VCASAAAGTAIVTDDGFRIPAGATAALDLLLDGRRVWSFAPVEFPRSTDTRQVPWPRVLRRFLHGTATVTVREHLTGTVLVDEVHAFAGAQGPVTVADPAGRPFVVDKNGHLERDFSTGGAAAADALLDNIEQVLAILRDECDVSAFLAYGTLLGAVREQGLIGHDVDGDVWYLSKYENPVDVALESFRTERVVRSHGYPMHRFSADDAKVLYREPDGAEREFDVFGSFFCEGKLYLLPVSRLDLPRSAIVPLTEVDINGRRFPAPAEPERVLGAVFGPQWRVPDPSFQHREPPEVRRRLDGWFRGMRPHRGQWEGFYRSRGADVSTEASPFVRWVADRETDRLPVVDIGSGNGRDALFFARRGHDVHGVDFAHSAVGRSRAHARKDGLGATFDLTNLYDLRQVLALGTRLAHGPSRVVLYARLLLHTLDPAGVASLWLLASMALRRGGRLYLEFVTTEDNTTHHVFGKQFRRPLDPGTVVREIEQAGGRIDYREEGTGLAPYGDEDPHVCRMVARWSQ
jgi:SAM-dependent methyltransferase